MNTFGERRPTFLQRIGWKLLPPTRLNIGVPHPLPNGFSDAITITTEVQLGLSDRLRVLLQGKLIVGTVTLTEHKPGYCETTSGSSTA